MNLNQFIYDTIAHDPSNYPELECHSLDQGEFLTCNKAEDENDFGYICRYHEQYLDDEKPSTQEMAEELSEHITNYVWDFANSVALKGMNGMRGAYEEWSNQVFDQYAKEQAYKYAKKWTDHLGAY
jgi:hypothetical protein